MRPRAFERTGSPPPPVGEQSKDFTLDNGSVVHTDENGIPDYIEVPPEGDETTPESGQESDTEYEDVKPGRESAENAAEVQANETLRTDQEFLGRHYPVRQLVEKASNARKGVVASERGEHERYTKTLSKTSSMQIC